MNTWEAIIKYVNDSNGYIRPFEVRKYINDLNIIPYGVGVQTVAGYINYLHKAKYLERPKTGWYLRRRIIPSDLSLKTIKKFIYNYGKTADERNKLVERYWKIIDLKNNIHDN